MSGSMAHATCVGNVCAVSDVTLRQVLVMQAGVADFEHLQCGFIR